jgi:hypothetical protein
MISLAAQSTACENGVLRPERPSRRNLVEEITRALRMDSGTARAAGE